MELVRDIGSFGMGAEQAIQVDIDEGRVRVLSPDAEEVMPLCDGQILIDKLDAALSLGILDGEGQLVVCQAESEELRGVVAAAKQHRRFGGVLFGKEPAGEAA